MIKKILIVGFGSSGKRYNNIIKKHYPNILVKIFSQTNKNKKNFIKLAEIKKYKPQLSIICNPSTKRINIINILSNLNSNMLIEKPLSSSIEDLNKIQQLIKNRKIVVKVGYNLRFLNSLKIFKKLVQINKIGKIYHVNIIAGQSLTRWRKNTNYQNTVSAKKKWGGGVLLELSHEIDYCLWIFGNFSKLFCLTSKISNLKVDVEDNSQILFFSKNKYTVNINLDFIRKDPIRKCHIIGSLGSLVWDGNRNNVLYLKKNEKKWEKINFKKNNIKDTYLTQLKEMFKICNSKKNKITNLASINEASKIIKIINNAKYSSKVKKVINFK